MVLLGRMAVGITSFPPAVIDKREQYLVQLSLGIMGNQLSFVTRLALAFTSPPLNPGRADLFIFSNYKFFGFTKPWG